MSCGECVCGRGLVMYVWKNRVGLCRGKERGSKIISTGLY